MELWAVAVTAIDALVEGVPPQRPLQPESCLNSGWRIGLWNLGLASLQGDKLQCRHSPVGVEHLTIAMQFEYAKHADINAMGTNAMCPGTNTAAALITPFTSRGTQSDMQRQSIRAVLTSKQFSSSAASLANVATTMQSTQTNCRPCCRPARGNCSLSHGKSGAPAAAEPRSSTNNARHAGAAGAAGSTMTAETSCQCISYTKHSQAAARACNHAGPVRRQRRPPPTTQFSLNPASSYHLSTLRYFRPAAN